MRILIVCSTDLDNASAKQALWFAEEIVCKGHRVLLALRGKANSAILEDFHSGPDLELMRYHPGVRAGADRASLSRAAAFRPTLIHAWNPQVLTVAAVRRFHIATGAPTFVHWEDDDWSMRKGMPGRSLYRVLGFKARQVLAHAFPALGHGFVNAASLSWINEHAIACDALTPALAQAVEDRIGRDCVVIFPVTPRAAEASRRSMSLSEAVTDEAVIAYTGTIGPASVNDLAVALEAIALLQSQGRQVVLVHAGTVLPRYDLLRMVEQAGVLPHTVVFLGQLPFTEMPPLLNRADIAIQPGAPTDLNRLRLPSKLQAYLATGTPTITYATGFAELLEDRVDVLKLYTGRADELAHCISEVLDDPQLRGALERGARGASRRWFDPNTNTEALLAHYHAGINPPRQPAAAGSTT